MSNKFTCEVCGFEAKSAQGLVAHKRLMKHGETSNEGENSRYNGCMHDYRKLTEEELNMVTPDGRTLKEAGYILVCTKCDKLF